MKKMLALFLALVQLVTLLPMLSLRVQAADTTSSEMPALNRMIVGTIKFQSFNFLGDNATGSDGVDYSSTFYYTDDYFSPSAIHETDSTSLKWSDLTEAELSLASMSFDFATAAYATNVGNVMTATSRTWDNTDYSDKAKNARDLLTTCGFENFEAYDYGHAPTNDSIAYVIASKKIRVWDETANANRDFTLIAVGVRGAGYGAEWASNVTIGNKNTNQLPANGRHWGFDNAATEICSAIQTYLSDHNITQDAKYWITGFSRAGATANLVAGYVTDDAATTYHTRQQDVFGYTWECPQAASTTEITLNYKNIHNILNAMDAVPKVSPDAFEHQRLGVDFVMPYYGNTTSSQNTTYYTNMREVLKTIAVGAYNYKGEYYTEDPLISVTDPSNYPYNRPVSIYTVSARQLIDDGLSGSFGDNFGTVHVVTGFLNRLSRGYVSSILGGEKWYMDKFIDELIDVFLVSPAWDRDFGDRNTVKNYSYERKVSTHETRFIGNYQKDFRNVLGYLLDYSGPAFMGMVDNLMDAVGNKIGTVSWSNVWSNVGFALDFAKFYFISTSESNRLDLINSSKEMAVTIVNDMTSDFSDPQGISRTDMNDSLRHLVSLVIDLYADELDEYESQYFGTSLHNMWQILCTHEQEVVMSWIKSLDQNHINRGYRTLTVPKGTDVKMYLCRSGYGETLGFDTAAPLVAEVKNGAFVPLSDPTGKTVQTLDDRISVTESGENMVIRYPSLLDLRFDVTTDTAISDLSFALSDYRTNAMATALSDGEKQYDPAQFSTSSYTQFASNGANTWNALSNSSIIPLAANETLSITARHTSAYDENDTASNLFYNMRKHADTTRVIDFSAVTTVANDAQTLSGETSRNGQFLRNATAKTVTYQLNSGAQLSSGNAVLSTRFADVDTASVTHSAIGRLTQDEALTVVPASSVYYDDDLAGQTFTSDGHGYSSDINDAAVSKSATDVSGAIYFTFYGTGIDVYCTTHSGGGYVSAAVFKTDDPNNCNTNTRIKDEANKAITVKNQSSADRYNTPTISFTGLSADTYTVKISANGAAAYKLDGVRVYNPVQTGSAAETALNQTDEANATYLNLRALLLNAESGFSVTQPDGMSGAVDTATISGVLFVDEADKIVTTYHDENGNDVQKYSTQFDVYKANGPKGEIYLSNNQAITFQLNTSKVAPGSKVWIGLSAPETGSGTVTITGKDGSVSVNSVMDMYYDFTVPSTGSVTITNTGSSLISVTNLKVTGVAGLLNVAAPDSTDPTDVSNSANSDAILSAKRAVFAPVTLSTVRMAANNGVDPEATVEEPETPDVPDTPDTPDTPDEPDTPDQPDDPKPGWSNGTDVARQILSSFLQSLMNSMKKLFGGLGGW